MKQVQPSLSVTLEAIGQLFDQKLEEKIEKKIDALAISVKAGFDAIDERFNGVDEQFCRVDERFIGVNTRLTHLEQGQKDIRLRLDNVAYRFEINDLSRRVTILEQRS